jgi:hypothetical protein
MIGLSPLSLSLRERERERAVCANRGLVMT